MLLTSALFFRFLAVVVLLFYLVPRRGQKLVLLVASYWFYAAWSHQFPVVLATVTLFNFWLPHFYRPGRSNPANRLTLWFGIIVNLLGLAFFKNVNFFLPAGQIGSIRLLLPIGLSFYSLGAISYLVDSYRGQMKPVTSLLDFALYMAYFPKLLSGPIERARVLLPRLTTGRVVNNEMIAQSLTLIVVGLVRKVVIADTLTAIIPADAFVTPGRYPALPLLLYISGYIIGLYNDFAGYTSIARGVSGLFGVELSRNFSFPLSSTNFTEFWNRWHITLSHWLRDYLYFPLSRTLLRRNPSRDNRWNIILPPLVTMLVSGIWHGATPNLLVWGGLNGLFQVIERFRSLNRPAVPEQPLPGWRRAVGRIFFIGLVLMTAVPFRMSLPVSLDFYRGLLSWLPLSLPDGRLFLMAGLGLLIDFSQHWASDELVFRRWPPLTQSTLLALALLAIFLITRADTGGPFIYQGF